MSPPTLRNRLLEHLRQHARPGLLSDSLLHLLSRMLCFNPAARITAADALRHAYFADCAEAAAAAAEPRVAAVDDGQGRSAGDMLLLLEGMRLRLRLRLAREEGARAGADMPGL